jgi:hypothetical protein
MRISELIVPGFDQMLQALMGQIDKANAHIAPSGPAFEERLALRLAADMGPLAAQIRFTCQQAREAVDRLLGRPVIVVPEIHSLGQAREQIAEARQCLTGADRAALDASAEVPLELVLPTGQVFDLDGRTYVRDWAVPQFYFHLCMAYAIMRHAGVPLGKADYVPHMFAHLRQ